MNTYVVVHIKSISQRCYEYPPDMFFWEELTHKAPITTAADNTFKYIFLIYFS